MVDKVRQNLDVNEVSELNLESSRPQTLPESEERDDLLRDFSLEVLTDTSKSAFYEVKSKDEELGIPATNFALYGKNISHIPEIFRDLPEGKDLFNLIRRPSTDLRQIHQRQVIVEALIQNNDLDVLIGIKNSVYNVTQGIQLLFAPIDIDEYRKETALFAYRHGYEQRAHATVFQALQLLENGKAALAEFAKRLKADLSPFIRKIAETIEELNQSTEPFTRKYFLEDDYDESETTGCGYKVQKANGEIGMFLEFARVAKNDGYAKCTFDADKPFEYRQGWNLFRQKNGNCPQVPNDSPRHTPVTVYTGSNMSGKSFQMKTGFFMQLAGQTCGFAPCKSGNFGIYDSFHFLDRASTHHSINLSAFGVEVSDWNQTIEKFGRRPFVCCDEGWSTTSPEDQHSLIAGTDLYLRERSARVFFATHNEKFIQRHNDDQNVGLYHLQIDVAEDGKVKYHYRLRENRDAPAGAADSRAIDIGRALGLDPQLIELALAYLQGKSVDIEAAAKKTGRPIARYTEEDRERLKRQGYVQAPSQDRQCLILSEDSDFHASWYGGIDISDTYRRADRATKFMNDHRKSSLHRFIFEREFDSDSRAVLERQHTFETLSACDRYPELLELEREIIYLVTFFPMILYNRSVAPRLLEFNRAIHPFGYGGRHRGRLNDYHEKDIYMDYLKLNEKMFANDFPYKEKSDEFKVLCELCDVMDRLMLDIDLDAIIAAQDKELNEEIASEDVVRVFRELIGDGPVTRRAIADYLEKKRFEVLSDLRENPKIKLLQSVTAYCPSDHDILKKRKKSILKKFREVREAAEGRRDRQRREPITMRRLLELKGKIDIDHKCYETVDFLLQDFERALCDFDFSKGIGKKLTPQCVRNAVVAKMQELDALINELPPRSVFELDIEGIRPYVKSLIDYRRREFDERCERGFNDRIDTEDRDVNFVMCAGFLLDSEDKIKHYTDLLRSFDSVHCHQLANDLEKLIKDFMQAKKESSAPFYLCTGPRLFSAFNGFYEDSVKTKDMELRVLEERRAKMVASHPWVFNGPRGDLSQTCVEFMGYCGNLPASVDKARNFIDEFGWFKRNGEHNNYFDRLNRRESPQRVAADFFEKEVKNSPEFKEVREVVRELVAIGGE
ncbi:hypothetical protein HZC21_04190, partial [Candidatus Peregrinibacteria bacterium]|nr:hypothetical protein [Candidatus Peregrinibacteria bacterium]